MFVSASLARRERAAGIDKNASLASHASRGDASAPNVARGAALPAEIAFLAAYGHPVGALVAAAAEARRTKVRPQAALIASGAVAAEQYYQALARHFGVPYVTDPATLGPGPGDARAVAACVGAVAPGAGQFVIAPQGAMLSALFHVQHAGVLPGSRVVVTEPRRFAAWVRGSAAREIAVDASLGLPRFDPDLSAVGGAASVQAWAFAGLLSTALAAWWFSPLLWLILAQALAAVMAAGVWLRLRATIEACVTVAPKREFIGDADLPVYTLIVPLYREADVAAKLVAALDRLDYPRAKLDIKIVVEADDAATREAFEALSLPPWYDIIVAPDGAPRTKPRALNVALPFARGSLVTVYDAEDEPERGQLRIAAARFARAPADVACLQARLAIDNSEDSWLAALFAIEYAALFDVVNPGLAALGLPMALGGTSNHFRADALRDIRGWDAWNVTEDADLGFRLARFGYRVETIDSTTHEEAPAAVGAWLGQRRRWQKGWVQTFLTLGRNPARLVRELGARRAAAALALLSAGVLGPLLGPALIGATLYDAVAGDLLRPATWPAIAASTYWCACFVLCLASILAPALIGIRRRGLWAEAKALPLLPVYLLLMSWAAWRGLVELAFKPFHWSKTRHGLARSSRRRRPAAPSPT